MKQIKRIAILMFLILTGLFMNAQECTNCYNQFHLQQGEHSSHTGLECNAFGDYSFSGGWFSETGTAGRASFAFGYLVKALDDISFAMGYGAEARGDKSFAFGVYAISEGSNSKTFGTFVTGLAPATITMGMGYSQAQPLVNSRPSSFALGFNSDVATFFVGSAPGPMSGTTGKVGIGTMDPEAKLHIRSDEGEEADLLIQPSIWTTKTNASIKLGNDLHVIAVDGISGMTFRTPQDRNFAFLYGNVGIGTLEPHANLDVEGTVRVGSNLNVEGNVGIGITLAEEKLHVAGTVLVEGFSMPQDGIENGFVLTTDIDGKGSWVPNQYLWEQGVGDDIYRELGYVGIGVNNPTERLHVSGNIQVDNNIIGRRGDTYEPLKIMANYSDIDGAYISLASIYNQEGSIKLFARGSSGRIEFHNQNRQIMSIRANNNVYFGDPNNPTHIYVNGEINASLVRVTVETWEDRVFNPDYKLLALHELELFIQANHHLPDIPSEQHVLEEGIDIGEMNALLLKKIEELTLYMIELKKENDEIRKKIDVIRKQ